MCIRDRNYTIVHQKANWGGLICRPHTTASDCQTPSDQILDEQRMEPPVLRRLLLPRYKATHWLASSVMASLSNVWKSRHLSIPTKIRVYQALVTSVLLYAAETWTVYSTYTMANNTQWCGHSNSLFTPPTRTRQDCLVLSQRSFQCPSFQ